MSPRLEFGCLPTAIGDMPHTDATEACRLILKYLPTLPFWPQLSRRSLEESMYIQFSEGFPGIAIEGEHIYINRSSNLDPALERLYNAYLEEDTTDYAISPEYASGLHALLSMKIEPPLAVKGQIIGPVSWGLSVTDGLRYVIYDETIAEAMARHLRLKASWQEKALSQISMNTIIFVDEPYLTSLGSPFVSLSSEQAVALLKETLEGIRQIRGLHCCGNADWPMLLTLPIDILSFDTYNYTTTLSVYPAEVKSFLEQGRAIAWGIVPNDEEALAKETIASLSDRLEEAIAPFTRNGLRFRQLIDQGLLTPSCGLGSLSPEAAEQALELLAQLSAKIRKRYIT